VSDDKRAIKVTDKRMFTPEGELREEYRFLGEKSTAVPEPEEPSRPVPTPAAALAAAPAAGPFAEPPWEAEEADGPPFGGPALEMPGTPPEMGGATFFDLIGMLAEPIAIYLGDVALPSGESAENLEMAQIHIDLLDVVRQKTRGNLSAQESAVLEDILYRSRLRYVQRRG